MAATAVRRLDGSLALSLTYSRLVVERLKDRIPAYARTYDPDRKVWTVDRSWATVAIDILEWEFGRVDVVEEDRRQYAAPSPPGRSDPAFATLFLLPTAPPEIITVVYRELARRWHPDRGGDTARMQALNAAYDDLAARGAVGGRS